MSARFPGPIRASPKSRAFTRHPKETEPTMTMTHTDAANKVASETKTAKRGRPTMTFAEIVASEPNELHTAMAKWLTETFHVAVTPKAVSLITMASVRKLWHASAEYKAANVARQERIDMARKLADSKSVDSLLAKLSPDMLAMLRDKLS